jgi:PAT family beta-lactamase induction signal transducer AmpG
MLSGYIQEYLGYGNFFIWVFLQPFQDNFISLFDFSSRFWKKSEQEKTN